MFSLVYIELKPVWIMVDGDGYRHQVYEGHRWSVSHAGPDKIEQLVSLLRGVGTVTEKLQAYPASIEVVPTVTTASVVTRIQNIMDTVFGH